jgi:hypothetical protein
MNYMFGDAALQEWQRTCYSSRRVLEEYPIPVGRVPTLAETTPDNHHFPAYASLVKYLVRHTSEARPERLYLEGVTRETGKPNREILRHYMQGITKPGLPDMFLRMVEALLNDEMINIPRELYIAGFAREILGPNRNHDEVEFSLLHGCGFNVHR